MSNISHINNVAIIGAGSWGTAIAKLIAETHPAINVRMWAYEKTVVSSINRQHTNQFLPGIKLPSNITSSNSLGDILADCPVVLFATPSKVLPDIAARSQRFLVKDAVVGYLTKGFCRLDNQIVTISKTIETIIPSLRDKTVAISGPSHAEEVSEHFHTCLNVGSKSEHSRSVMISILDSKYLQCRGTDDIIGVEVGGTLKNPAAIAAGIIAVLPGCGDNLAGALISEALKEMLLLGKFFEAREDTIIDVSGLGDLVATALSEHSRNRRFGKDIGRQIVEKGYALTLSDRILLKIRPHLVLERMSKNLHYLAEGAYAIEPLIELAEKNNIVIPVYRSLYEVLLNRKEPSLLIETIKNPQKFFDLYSESKMHVTERKQGLEGLRGTTFVSPITEKSVKYLETKYTPDELTNFAVKISSSRDTHDNWSDFEKTIRIKDKKSLTETLKKICKFYTVSISDFHLSPVKNLVIISYHIISKIFNKHGQSSADIIGKTHEVKKLKVSTSIIYISKSIHIRNMIHLLYAMRLKNMALPRFVFFREETGWIMERLLKMTGGISISKTRMDNEIFRSVVFNYITTMLEHGLPVLFQCNTGEHLTELHSCISSSLMDHGGEISYFALVPSEYEKGKPGLRYNLSSPLILSDFTRMDGELDKVDSLLLNLLNY